MSSTSYRQSLAILCCALPFAATAQASNSIPSLDNIVVTASRSAQLASEVVGDVTVIDKQELERAGQTSVAEILARQPGVQFNNSGGPQTQTSLYLRGTNPNHTLVLVNGIRINGPATGATNWNTIDPALVERIEVVRGAASSLYGSDAIGGVINIITKTDVADRPLSAWGNIGYGSNDTFKSSIGLSGAQDGWDYSLGSSMSESNGFNVTTPANQFGEFHPDRDGYSQHALNGTLGYRWAPGQHIGITAYNSYVNGDFDSGEDNLDPVWGYIVHPALSITRQQAYTVTSTNTVSDNWESILRFGYAKEYGESRVGDSDPYKFGSQQRSFSWQNNFRVTTHHEVSIIMERLEERPSGSNSFSVTRRNTNAVGAIYKGKFDSHRVQASLRNDNISEYGNRVTGGLGYDFDLTDSWTIGAAANTGFRMPTFTDMYGPNFPGIPGYAGFYSNPDLKPEKSKNIELSARYRNDTTNLALTVYQNKIKDLVTPSVCFQYDPSGDCTATHSENINKATIRGLTLSGSHTLGNTTFHGSADLMQPRDDATRNTLQRRARQVYNLGVNHRIEAWDLGAEYQFVGKRYDDVANTQEGRLGGYSLFNLTAAYDFTKNVGVQVRWNNVFDKDYTTVYGYNTPGSNVFVNLSFRM